MYAITEIIINSITDASNFVKGLLFDKSKSYRLKKRKEFVRQKQQIMNPLFEQENA